MQIIGCDLHARQQTIAMLDTDTGELIEKVIEHEGEKVQEFYSALDGQVLVGIEATGSMQWFLRRMEELGIECRVGHPAKIRKAETRKQKHDRRDALLLSAKVFKLTPSGNFKVWDAGFTTVVGLAFDNRDRLYVLELSDSPGFPNPGAGKLVRVSPSGQVEDILTGLVVPTAITIGPGGAIYISNFGAAPPGSGQILRVEITD